MKLLKKKQEKGFTLVELLVVLAIVGILIGLAIGGIQIVQEVNRDTQRKALVRDIQLALESHQEKTNRYPGDISLTAQGSGCDGVYIDAGGETVCSSVNYDVSDFTEDDCSAYPTDAAEDESGKLTGCYEGTTKAYYLYVELERSSTNYDGGNVLTD